VIADLNPILRGWGNYFRTGNAADKFVQADWYVAWRLHLLMVKSGAATCTPGKPTAGLGSDSKGMAWFRCGCGRVAGRPLRRARHCHARAKA